MPLTREGFNPRALLHLSRGERAHEECPHTTTHPAEPLMPLEPDTSWRVGKALFTPNHSLLGPGAKFPTVATMFLSSFPASSLLACRDHSLQPAFCQLTPASRAALVGFECTKMTRSFRPWGLLGKIFQNTHTHTEPNIFLAEPN